MFEFIVGILLIIGIISLLGACTLLFYAGMQLSRAIEIHSDTMNAIINLRENTQKDYSQIQEWIEVTNVQAAEAELKNATNVDRLARTILELNKELTRVKDSFAELTLTKKEFLN
jgi:malonyl CoA-acyl carrier protein transacylase